MNFGKHLLFSGSMLFAAIASSACAALDDQTYSTVISSNPAIGDIVFTRTGGPLFTGVAAVTKTWTSHVGIIVDYQRGDWIVAESGIPFVRKTALRKFLGRSEDRKFAIMRLKVEPTAEQKAEMLKYADSRKGTPYCLGFDLDSKWTFCSKFVHEDVYESTHQSLGEIETFDHLLHSNPNAQLWLWRAWFLGDIPWQRRTITPASELRSALLRVVIQNNL
jgi:hypothetical protein